MDERKNGPKRRHSGLPSKDRDKWRIRWVDSDGKRRSRSFPKNAYKEAVAELERIKGEIRSIKDGRKPPNKTVPTLKDFSENFWKPNRTFYKRSPKDDVSILKKHLIPAFGALPLTHITTEKIETFKGELAQNGLKPKTINNILTLLNSILVYATEMDFIYRKPKVKKTKLVTLSYQYLSEGEIKAFLRAAKERGPDVHALFATAVFTGMRAGELFGLPWSDVDFEKRLITVQRSFHKPTKSGTVRYIPIFDVLAPILREWRLQNPNPLVFPNNAGNMQSPAPRVVKFVFPQVLEAAELPRIRFHDLRHTFASHWVLKSGDLFKLQKILGHADQQMVQRYAHLAPEAFENDRGIFGTEPPKPAEVREMNFERNDLRKKLDKS